MDDGSTTLRRAAPTLREIERVVGEEEENALRDGNEGGLGLRRSKKVQWEQRTGWEWRIRR